MGPETDTPLLEGIWDQAARQKLTSYRDPPPVNRMTVKILPCPKLRLQEVNLLLQQECIPVPPALYCLPDRDPLRQKPPGQRTPPPGQRTPWTETPLDRDPLDRDPLRQKPPWTETPLYKDAPMNRQTPVKILLLQTPFAGGKNQDARPSDECLCVCVCVCVYACARRQAVEANMQR